MTLVIDNVGELVTNSPELGAGPLGIIENASVVIDGDAVVAVGPAGAVADQRLDAGGRCAIPGFVDSTPTWCSPATGRRSSRGGWRANPTTAAGSG